jgi:hypothetical protein
MEAFENVSGGEAQDHRAAIGRVVGEDVRSKRSMSQRIFSGESGIFTLMDA